MKLSTITSAAIIALAAVVLIAGGASASAPANNLNFSKTNHKLDAGNPDAEKQCIEKGGSATDDICVIPVPDGTAQPAAASPVKTTKSNTFRTGGTPQPAEVTTVKSSKSNSQDRTGDTGGGPPQPAGSANLNLSKSNINRTGGTAPEPTEEKKICIIYKPGHEGDDRYCSQSVPAPK